MAAVSVRGLDDQVRERLRVRAARNGRSMEAEMRSILIEAVREDEPSDGLFTMLLDRFGALGGVDLEFAPRVSRPRSADLPA